MPPLHIRLLVADRDREDVTALVQALRAAGHVVVDRDVTDLPEGVAPHPEFVITEGAALPAPERLDAAEARHLRAVLRFTRGNKRHAAGLLGIARSTLLAKIRKYRIDDVQ
ncbi:MAG: helix-turn-helix domain-containing protein [Gemmatimonadales bacterium]